jgi:hypothetical protein
MSLLSIIRDATAQIGVARPSAVIGNNNIEILKLLRYANQTGIHLRMLDWQNLRAEQSFDAVATEAQTSTMLPTDWDHFINETFWNRTRKMPFTGPLSPQDWQRLKATTGAAITNSFTYRASIFYIQPVPTAGDDFYYEYGSKNFCESSGGTDQSAWAADTDTGRIDEEMFTLGCIYRFKKGESLPWQDDFGEYKEYVLTKLGQDSPRKTLRMGTERMMRVPGIGVPEGFWNL